MLDMERRESFPVPHIGGAVKIENTIPYNGILFNYK